MHIKVAGSRSKPLQLVADAKAVGPWLEFAIMPEERVPTGTAAAVDAGLAPPLPVPAGITGARAEAPVQLTKADMFAAAGITDSTCGSSAGPDAAALGDGSRGDIAAGSSQQFSTAGGLQAEASSASQLTSITTASHSRSKHNGGKRSKAKQEPAAPQWGAGAAITFDKVQVLLPHSQQLLLRNPTVIDSEVKLFVEGRDSVFEVSSARSCALLSVPGGTAGVL